MALLIVLAAVFAAGYFAGKGRGYRQGVRDGARMHLLTPAIGAPVHHVPTPPGVEREVERPRA